MIKVVKFYIKLFSPLTNTQPESPAHMAPPPPRPWCAAVSKRRPAGPARIRWGLAS